MAEYPDHTRVAQKLLDQQGQINELAADAERFKQDHLGACKTIAEMHAAATGRTGEGPVRGVVEDVADVRTALLRAEQERDGAYRERVHLLAWLATLYAPNAVLAPALDIDDEDGWHLLFLTVAGRQLSWHIAPRDMDLLKHVERVDFADPRAQWDGHTTDEKYQRIRTMPWGEMRAALCPVGPVNLLVDDEGVPLCVCTVDERCPNCPPDTKD